MQASHRKNGAMVQPYLFSAIDDRFQYVIHSHFYDNQEEAIIEDMFQQVILKTGKFNTAYFDNDSQYVIKQLKYSLARLGIESKSYCGDAKRQLLKEAEVI